MWVITYGGGKLLCCMHILHVRWWPRKMAAYFRKKRSFAWKGNFENLGAVFRLFAATASRQQERDVYNLGSPLPPPLEAFHTLLLLLQFDRTTRLRTCDGPSSTSLYSRSPAVRAHLYNHPLCHQALLWKLMRCSERTVMQRRGRIWFFILPARKAASGNEELLVLGAWLRRQSPAAVLKGVTQWRGTMLPQLRVQVRKGTLDSGFSETVGVFCSCSPPPKEKLTFLSVMTSKQNTILIYFLKAHNLHLLKNWRVGI